MKFKSALMTQASGSTGGLVASHNRGGMYFRARSIPVNPGSAQQQSVRTAMSNLVTAWSQTLTTAQRAAWEVYATNVPVVNAVGDTIQLSGINMYCRSNVSRLQVGVNPVNDGPTTYDTGSFTPVLFTADPIPPQYQITIDNSDDWANEDDAFMLVYGSRPQGVGINYFKGPYRKVDGFSGSIASPPVNAQTCVPAFTFTTGQKVFLQVRVSRADGRLSGVQRISDEA